jgi:TatD DNase family protein
LELLKIAPKENILTETDSPYLSPFKGKQNESAYIKETIKVISELWNLNEEETEKIIEENTYRIFNFNN